MLNVVLPAMANPIQQGLKLAQCSAEALACVPAMANPIQQGLKLVQVWRRRLGLRPAMANPIQQGLKPDEIIEFETSMRARNG